MYVGLNIHIHLHISVHTPHTHTHAHAHTPHTHAHTHTRAYMHSSHAITADLSSAEMSKGAEYCGSDGVILTGPSTGYPAKRGEVARVREACQLPVLVGSGVSAENVGHYLDADAMIVGSDFKTGGAWWAELERERLVRFMERVYALRQ